MSLSVQTRKKTSGAHTHSPHEITKEIMGDLPALVGLHGIQRIKRRRAPKECGGLAFFWIAFLGLD
ncbi:MAG TPA: hypothetical protein VF452_01720 [Candidatus Binatia bacterium]